MPEEFLALFVLLAPAALVVLFLQARLVDPAEFGGNTLGLSHFAWFGSGQLWFKPWKSLWVGAWDAVGENRRLTFKCWDSAYGSIISWEFHFDSSFLAWFGAAQRLAISIVSQRSFRTDFRIKKYLEVNSGMALIHLQKQTLYSKL